MKLFAIPSLLITGLTLALLLAPSAAFAQSNRTLEQLSELNRINPLQNPEFEKGKDVLSRKILDRKNKVIGEVQDIIVNPNGTIASIETDLDRLRLGSDVYLNYRSLRIRTVSDAYALNMDADEVTEFYPQLLADISTASGDSDDSFSMRKLIGANITAKDGRKLGKVDDLLLGANGGIVRAVYTKLSHRTQRGDTVAVPFRNFEFQNQNGRITASVSNNLADSMLKIADD